MRNFTGFITVSAILSFFLLFPISVGATPSLGVWPGDLASLEIATSLQGPFAFTGGDPTDITVWFGNEDSPFNPSVDVWIGSTEGGHAFGGLDLNFYSSGSPPNSVPSFWHTFGDNYALNLGSYNSPNLDLTNVTWSIVGSGPLTEGVEGTFVAIEGQWTGGLGGGEWIYAMADTGGATGVFQQGKDDFSPPTMSTVPEPATVVLVGSGLLLLGLLGRRKFKTVR